MSRMIENSYRDLDARLMTMDESEVDWALTMERAGAGRRTVLKRLHQRLTRLRAAREKAEIGY